MAYESDENSRLKENETEKPIPLAAEAAPKFKQFLTLISNSHLMSPVLCLNLLVFF